LNSAGGASFAPKKSQSLDTRFMRKKNAHREAVVIANLPSILSAIGKNAASALILNMLPTQKATLSTANYRFANVFWQNGINL
jgi:hypothetical protein